MKNPTAVINRDTAPYSEKWKETPITIQPGHAIIMSRRDASDFLGSYSGADPQNPQHPKVKALTTMAAEAWKGSVDQTIGAKTAEPAMAYVCNYDGMSFPTQELLDAHLATHSDKVIKEELADAEGPVSCPFCGQQGLRGHKGLKTHMAQHCPKLVGDKNDASTGVLADTVAG